MNCAVTLTAGYGPMTAVSAAVMLARFRRVACSRRPTQEAAKQGPPPGKGPRSPAKPRPLVDHADDHDWPVSPVRAGRTTVTVQVASAATLADTLPSKLRSNEFCRAPITM